MHFCGDSVNEEHLRSGWGFCNEWTQKCRPCVVQRFLSRDASAKPHPVHTNRTSLDHDWNLRSHVLLQLLLFLFERANIIWSWGLPINFVLMDRFGAVMSLAFG